MRKQREEGNSAFYLNKTLLNKIRRLADKKEIEAVKELVETEVDKFISLWSTNKAFREDYERRILPSLDNRQMSRDGRQRNFDEKPILAAEKATPPETEAVSRALPKQAPPPKEDVVAPTPVAAPAEKEKSSKAQKEPNKAKGNNAKAVDDEAAEPDFYVPEQKQKDPPKMTEADELKLKALKREQEIAKAKQALDRKKKLSEKAAAKAAIRAQKEAEKKQKALEKKEKKKAGVSADEPKEKPEAEVAESEKSAEEPAETTVPSSKIRKESNPMRRKTRTRESGPLPRTLLKRKKATNYWMWAAPAGAAITLLLVAVGYYYLN